MYVKFSQKSLPRRLFAVLFNIVLKLIEKEVTYMFYKKIEPIQQVEYHEYEI